MTTGGADPGLPDEPELPDDERTPSAPQDPLVEALMADDTRLFIRVHDGMPDHPKIEPLSDKAFRLVIETWCWSSRHLTDGRVPKTIWSRRGTPAARRELVDAGLVEDAGDHVQVHDYLEHQRSRAQVQGLVAERQSRRSEAAVKGNHARWHVGPNGTRSDSCPLCRSDPGRTPDGVEPES